MLSQVFDIGDNLLQAIVIICAAAGPGAYAARQARQGRKAAEGIAGELKNNGGGTALDKLESGQREIMTKLGEHDARFAKLESVVAGLPDHDQPPPFR